MVYHNEEDAVPKSSVVLKVNNYFDVMNSKREVGKNALNCGLGVNKDAQIQALLEMKDLVTNMRFGNDPDRTKKKPFQKGILVSILSTLAFMEVLI